MLHADEDAGDGRISRTKFFGLCILGSFLYSFIPGEFANFVIQDLVRRTSRERSTDNVLPRLEGYLFAALSYFSWICWIRPSTSSLCFLPAMSES
jgi:hypothetical protein